MRAVKACLRCDRPKPRGTGRKLCDACREKGLVQASSNAKARLQKWQKQNPHKSCEYNRRHRAKNRASCRRCSGPMPFPSPGRLYCDDCQSMAQREWSKQYRRKIQKEYEVYKQARGCAHCGYCRYGGSLDFHHTDPAAKERRITARLWKAQSKLFLEEARKCILLCKNCHYEEQHREENGDVY